MNYENIKPYSDLAHTAAQNGGPKEYLDQIEQAGFNAGVMEEKKTEPKKKFIAAGVGAISSLLLAGIAQWQIKKQRKKLEAKQKEEGRKAEEAKAKILEATKAETSIGEEAEDCNKNGDI